MHGRLVEGWASNQAFVLVGLPAAFMLTVGAVSAACRGKTVRVLLPSKVGLALAVLVVLWFVLRNVPGFESLQPPP